MAAHACIAESRIDPRLACFRLKVGRSGIHGWGVYAGERIPAVSYTHLMGGSVPLYMIEETLHAPTITVPIANHDNNQHSFDENIRLENLWDGIDLLAALLAM